MYMRDQDLQLPDNDIQYYDKGCVQIPYQVGSCYRNIRFNMILRLIQLIIK